MGCLGHLLYCSHDLHELHYIMQSFNILNLIDSTIFYKYHSSFREANEHRLHQ